MQIQVVESYLHPNPALPMSDIHDYAGLFENAPMGIFRSTAGGRLLTANPALVALLGYASREQVLRLDLGRDVYVRASDRQALVEKIRSDTYENVTVRWRRADDTEITVRISGRPIEAEDGDGVAVYESFVEDVTEEVEARKALERVLASSGAILFRLMPGRAGLESVWISDNVEEILGYHREEALQPGWWAAGIHPDDRTDALEAESRVLVEDDVVFEFRFRTAGGEFLCFREELHLIRAPDGAPREAVGVAVDVTESKDREEALRRSEERFRRLTEVAPDAIVAADAEGVVVVANPAAERIFGYTAAEMLGRHFTFLFPERFRDINRRALQRMLESDAPETVPPRGFLGCRKDGSEFPAEVAISTDPGGGQFAITTIIRDLTRRLELEVEHNLLRKGLAHEDAAGRSLISICSGCKNIRDSEGDWHPVESYVRERAPIEFSHGICPVCVEKLYGDLP